MMLIFLLSCLFLYFKQKRSLLCLVTQWAPMEMNSVSFKLWLCTHGRGRSEFSRKLLALLRQQHRRRRLSLCLPFQRMSPVSWKTRGSHFFPLHGALVSPAQARKLLRPGLIRPGVLWKGPSQHLTFSANGDALHVSFLYCQSRRQSPWGRVCLCGGVKTALVVGDGQSSSVSISLPSTDC